MCVILILSRRPLRRWLGKGFSSGTLCEDPHSVSHPTMSSAPLWHTASLLVMNIN